MVRCAQMAKLIDMPFLVNTWMGRQNHVLNVDRDPLRRRGNFGGCPGIQKHWQLLLQWSLQKGSFNRQ